MAEAAEQVSVVDDPDATRNVLAIVPFSDPVSLAGAIGWLLAAPQLAPQGRERERRVPELRFASAGSEGVAELVLFIRKPKPNPPLYGGPENFAFVVVISARKDQA